VGQAFQSLVRSLLTQSEEALGRWRDCLLEALGPNGQLIVNLLPELELVIGKQPPVADLPPQDGNCSARWTQTNVSGRPDHNNGLIAIVVRTLYIKPTRHQTGAVERLLHGAESPQSKRQTSPKLHQK
jgi:hypothetical protein